MCRPTHSSRTSPPLQQLTGPDAPLNVTAIPDAEAISGVSEADPRRHRKWVTSGGPPRRDRRPRVEKPSNPRLPSKYRDGPGCGECPRAMSGGSTTPLRTRERREHQRTTIADGRPRTLARLQHRCSSRGCARHFSEGVAGRFDHVVTALLDADLHRSLLSPSLRPLAGASNRHVFKASSPEHLLGGAEASRGGRVTSDTSISVRSPARVLRFGPQLKADALPVEIEGCVNPVVSGDYT